MELLIVIIVIAVLAAIALPKFINSGLRSKEAALRSDLKLLRSAYERFLADTGAAPVNLRHMASEAPIDKGYDPVAAAGGSLVLKPISPSDWHGPYIDEIPSDPVTGDDFVYDLTSAAPNKPICSGNSSASLDGTSYKTW